MNILDALVVPGLDKTQREARHSPGESSEDCLGGAEDPTDEHSRSFRCAESFESAQEKDLFERFVH